MPEAPKAALMVKVFLGRLPVRFEKINAALALCRADPAAGASWRELHRLLDSLAEAAAAFGCEALAEQAALIELLLKDMLADGAPAAADIDTVARLLAELQAGPQAGGSA